MIIYSRRIPPVDLDETQNSLLLATEEYQEQSEESRFLYLTRIRQLNVDFGDILTPENRKLCVSTKYNLVANVVHDGEPNKGTFRVYILLKANGQWYEMQDLHVTEILPKMITLTESYIQIYKLNTSVEE